MSKLEAFRREREGLNLIRHSNRCGSHVKCCKFSEANSIEHEMKKAEICLKLLKEKRNFLTEAIFVDCSGKADIFLPAEMVIYEILHTETVAGFEKKKKKYPSELEIIAIKTGENKC